MKIGIFDSGLGGLQIMRGIVKTLPRYDFVYLGDTKRVPYGNRTQAEIYRFTRQAVDELFRRNCALIIIACNTASARALRKLQREYLPKSYPNRRILGVIVPTVEIVAKRKLKSIGVIGTVSTIRSNVYQTEAIKLAPVTQVIQKPTPLLVPMIERGRLDRIDMVLEQYLKPIKPKIQALLLGCTHYPILKQQIRRIVGPGVTVISQDEIIPAKLKNYLKHHPEIGRKLSHHAHRLFLSTKITPEGLRLAKQWFGPSAKLRLVRLKP